ncbi:hypothetical protein BC829DRAFT_189092 [Chytridium lagenaria]|nr:hypothetical protein BC829DRAFT_189092 [Chytridium lagenaria]
MSTTQRIIVTYADEYSIWPQIAEEIVTRLPLRNLLWMNGRIQQGQRLIESLDIDLKPFRPDMFPRSVPGTATPFFLHLYFVNCEDSDIYKSMVRKQIQDWLNIIANKKNQEWLIVYVGNSDAKRAAPRFLNVGGTVFEKIKADFGTKGDRVIQLKQPISKEGESLAEFFHRIKEGIVSSFARQVLQYEEDTRRLDAQRLLPGWNYCHYFVLKEGLACTFELMNIFEEALVQYDELEAAFFQNLIEQGAPWFQTFGGTDAGDDSNDILNTSIKPYRDMICKIPFQSSIFGHISLHGRRSFYLSYQMAHISFAKDLRSLSHPSRGL